MNDHIYFGGIFAFYSIDVYYVLGRQQECPDNNRRKYDMNRNGSRRRDITC